MSSSRHVMPIARSRLCMPSPCRFPVACAAPPLIPHPPHPPHPPAQTRRIKERLTILCSAVSRPVPPSKLLGRVVVRPAVDGVAGASRGRVVEHDEVTGFRVLYTDGDCEDVTLRELQAVRARSYARRQNAAEPVLRLPCPAVRWAQACASMRRHAQACASMLVS